MAFYANVPLRNCTLTPGYRSRWFPQTISIGKKSPDEFVTY